jgi:rhodanese-related sulfurtransferase
MAAEDSADDKERLQAVISTYQGKKAEAFPEVEDVTPAEALSLSPESVLFVDARSEGERATSVIPGAVSKEEFLQNGKELAAGKDLVITHCALGARGGNLAKEIKGAHPDLKVKNLEGALLAWAHAGGPLVDPSGAPTKTFHPGGPSQLKFAPKENGYEAKI